MLGAPDLTSLSRRRRGSRVRSWCTAAAATAATAALAVSGLALGGPSASAQPVTSPVPAAAAAAAGASAIAWQTCRSGFDCGRVQVPLDHDQPGGDQISLSLIRLPASSPSRRIGSLFLNPGGPGGSGVEFARDIAKFMPLEIRARFDIVGFDPRGIGESTPLRCFDTFAESVAVLPAFSFPVTTEQEREQRAANRTLAAACAEHAGPILNHMSTADVARDLDALREAVGDSRLSYVGFSYGSILGQTYANLFPHRVRALVIDGVVDPIAWTTGYGAANRRLPFSTRIGSAVGSQATLDEFFRLCDLAGPDCALAGDASGRFAALAARLREKPLEIIDPGTGQPFPLTYDLLISATLGALYQPESWPELAALLADVHAQASTARIGRQLKALLRHSEAPQEQYPNLVEGARGSPVPTAATPAASARGGRPPTGPSASKDISAACGRGPGACASPGPGAPARTATRVPGPRARPSRCWSWGTTSTRPRPIRVRGPPPGCCRTRGCCPTPAGATPPSSSVRTTASTRA